MLRRSIRLQNAAGSHSAPIAAPDAAPAANGSVVAPPKVVVAQDASKPLRARFAAIVHFLTNAFNLLLDTLGLYTGAHRSSKTIKDGVLRCISTLERLAQHYPQATLLIGASNILLFTARMPLHLLVDQGAPVMSLLGPVQQAGWAIWSVLYFWAFLCRHLWQTAYSMLFRASPLLAQIALFFVVMHCYWLLTGALAESASQLGQQYAANMGPARRQILVGRIHSAIVFICTLVFVVFVNDAGRWYVQDGWVDLARVGYCGVDDLKLAHKLLPWTPATFLKLPDTCEPDQIRAFKRSIYLGLHPDKHSGDPLVQLCAEKMTALYAPMVKDMVTERTRLCSAGKEEDTDTD